VPSRKTSAKCVTRGNRPRERASSTATPKDAGNGLAKVRAWDGAAHRASAVSPDRRQTAQAGGVTGGGGAAGAARVELGGVGGRRNPVQDATKSCAFRLEPRLRALRPGTATDQWCASQTAPSLTQHRQARPNPHGILQPVAIVRDETQRLLTVREVAHRLAVSPYTVYRRVAAGELRGVRVGNGPSALIRVRPDDLEEFLRPTGREAA